MNHSFLIQQRVSPLRPLPEVQNPANRVNLCISTRKLYQLLRNGTLHVEDLRCTDRHSQCILKRLLLGCCLCNVEDQP